MNKEGDIKGLGSKPHFLGEITKTGDVTIPQVVDLTQNKTHTILGQNKYKESHQGRIQSMFDRFIRTGRIFHRQDLYTFVMRFGQKLFPKYKLKVFQKFEDGSIYEHKHRYSKGNRPTQETENLHIHRIRALFEQEDEIHIDSFGGSIHLPGQQTGDFMLLFEGEITKEDYPTFIQGIEYCKILLTGEQRYIEGMYFDSLTGCRSRNFLSKIKNDTDYDVIAIDLNSFKEVNDKYGHSAGDELLKAFGKILHNCIRKGEDEIIRPSGDEFIIIVRKNGNLYDGVLSVNKRLKDLMDEGITTKITDRQGNKIEINIGFTAGVYLNEDAMSIEDAFKFADQDMMDNKSDEGKAYRHESGIKKLPFNIQRRILTNGLLRLKEEGLHSCKNCPVGGKDNKNSVK